MALPPIHHALHLSHLSFGGTVHQGCMYSLIPGQDTWAILGCRGDVEKYYPFLFCSSPPRCTVFRRQRDLYRLDIARAKKWNFCPPLWWDFPIRGTGLDHSGFSRISFFFEIIFPRPLRFLRIFAAFWSLSLYGIRVSLRQGIWCLDYAIYYVMNNCDCNLSRRQIYKIRIMNNVIFEINSILECNLIFVSLEAHLSINHCFITILVLPILI